MNPKYLSETSSCQKWRMVSMPQMSFAIVGWRGSCLSSVPKGVKPNLDYFDQNLPSFGWMLKFDLVAFFLSGTTLDAHNPHTLTLTPHAYVSYVCFKCFCCFICIFQVFHMDIAKVDWDVAYDALVVHVCCKRLFPMFHLFSDVCCKCVYLYVTYVSPICCKRLSVCCVCLQWF